MMPLGCCMSGAAHSRLPGKRQTTSRVNASLAGSKTWRALVSTA
jgi:hypothetical protein